MSDKEREPTPKVQETQPKKGEPIEIPIPKRETWEKLLTRAARKPSLRPKKD